MLIAVMPEVISSVQNPRVKNLVRLRAGTHRRRQQRFVVEGYREISRALGAGWQTETLFFCDDLFKAAESFELLHLAEEQGIELVQMSTDAFLKASYREGADGLLAICRQERKSLRDLKLGKDPLLVVVESIEKPGNLGAIFRTADAAGADALVVTGEVVDPFNPNCIRASQGALFSLPFCFADNPTLFDFLRRHEFRVVVTSPAADKLLWESDMSAASAIVFGSEDKGLSKDWLEMYEPYKLPMQGITDSLNVASMAAITLFEAVRQRTSRPLP